MKPTVIFAVLIVMVLAAGQAWIAAAEVVRLPSPQAVVDPIRVMFPRDSNSVTIRCVVGVNGRIDQVLDMEVTKLLRPAFEQAVRTWVFSPAYRNGSPVRSVVVIKFDYLVQPLGYRCTSASSEIQR